MSVKVLEGVYWVGAVDWDVRHFHGYTYTTPRGTTYNSYLILDEKKALIDGVYTPFTDLLLHRVGGHVDPSEIDYVVVNHLEVDHSGAVGRVLKQAKDAVAVGTESCRKGFFKYYPGEWNFQVVKTGDEIDLGKTSLRFIEAPMLHWPDTMFTYIPQKRLLFPNDIFGQHLATSKRFDDEVDRWVVEAEAAKYYANIFWPLSRLVFKKIEEIRGEGLGIDVIAPSHGVIWRKDPSGIMNAYLRWARGGAEDRVVIAYDTMWGGTGRMARKILEGVASKGIPAALYRIPLSDLTEVFGYLLEAKGLMVGSSTVNSSPLPSLSSFLEDIKGLKPRGRLGFAFGTYGWGGGAVEEIEKALASGGVEIVLPSYTVKWTPDEKELERCFRLGQEFADLLLKR